MIECEDLGIHLELSHTTSDELVVLTTEIENDNFFHGTHYRLPSFS